MPPAVISVEKSENNKTGNISTTYVSQKSCPKECPLLKAGCYAELGIAGLTTNRLNKGTISSKIEIAKKEAQAISKLSGDRYLRLHVVGDSSTEGGTRLLAKAAERYPKKVFTHTHAWRTVKRSSWGKISVLASCHTVKDIKSAKKRGYATALLVKKFLSRKVYNLGGEKILPCPAQFNPRKFRQKNGVTCEQCRLCMKDDLLKERGFTIGFSAHGNNATLARVYRKMFNEAFHRKKENNCGTIS